MKSTMLFVVAVLLTASSCRTTNLSYIPTSNQPYVTLKTGERFNGSSAERSQAIFSKDKIVLDDTSFNTKDVAFYSTGGLTYANVAKKSFATQVAVGKINLYKYEYTSTSYTPGYTGMAGMGAMGNNMSTFQEHGHITYFIQKKEGTPVMPLSYRYLQPMVEKGTPEFRLLEKYRKTRTVNRAIGFSTLGLLVGGIILNNASDDQTVQNIGTGMFATGFITAPAYLFYMPINRRKLLKSVMIADDLQRKKKNTKHPDEVSRK